MFLFMGKGKENAYNVFKGGGVAYWENIKISKSIWKKTSMMIYLTE